MKQDFDLHILPTSSIIVGFGAVNVFKKLKSVVGATENSRFWKNAKFIIKKIVQKQKQKRVFSLKLIIKFVHTSFIT